MALAMLFAGFVGLIVAAERRAPHNPEIDEGTYFVTARLVARGEPLYTATFCSQTPLYFELLALAVIRDNLTLNVVMLVWPVDAIRADLPRLAQREAAEVLEEGGPGRGRRRRPPVGLGRQSRAARPDEGRPARAAARV